MSIEKGEILYNKNVFPLQYNDVLKTASWTTKNLSSNNPYAQREINSFWGKRPNAYAFFEGLSRVRKRIYGWPQNEIEAYQRGLIFGIKSIESAVSSNNNSLITPSRKSFLSFFESLIAPLEFNRAELACAKEIIGKNGHDFFTPLDFCEVVDKNILSPEVLLSFSESLVNETRFHITGDGIDPTLKNFINDGQFYSELGPAQGLAFGTLDANMVLKRRYDQQQLTRMWKINN